MEYIQCAHCNKKYAVNDKVRAAAGRSIHCKGCGESFEIILFETPTASMPATHQASEKNASEAMFEELNQQQVHQPTARKKTPPQQPTAKKKRLSASMLLGVAIVILSVYVFYHDRSVDIGQPFVATETPKPSPNTASHTNLTHEPEAAAIAFNKPSHQTFSEACKNIAAQQWVMDYTMMHGVPESSEYVHMLDESTQNTAEIRKKCHGASSVQEILATATKGVPPKWLEKHVSALITLGKKTPHF